MNLIDKIAWVCIKNRKVLFVRSKGKDAFYNPGGKREGAESDSEALIREIKEEVSVDLLPATIKYLETFIAQAHGKPAGTRVEIKCWTADFVGDLRPNSEIEELAWLTSNDAARTSPTGQLTLAWLKRKNLID